MHDVRDELLNALDLLARGDTPGTAADDRIALHVRARSTLERTYLMANEAATTLDTMTAAARPTSPEGAAASLPVTAAAPATVSETLDAPVPPLPPEDAGVRSPLLPAFVQPDVRVVRAIGGPFDAQALAMYPNRTRWIVRDPGGERVSCFTDAASGPIDALPEALSDGMRVEGYYRLQERDHSVVWMPVAALADRVSGGVS